jgi:hypothetical protein
MIKRFFFDGINAETAGAAVGGEDNIFPRPHAHKAPAPLPVTQTAGMGADLALHAAIFQFPGIDGGRMHGFSPC